MLLSNSFIPVIGSLALLDGVLAWSGKRYAHFHNEYDCEGAHGKDVDMTNHGCLTQYNRKSASLGDDMSEGGIYCMVYYSDDHCDCIEGAYVWNLIRPVCLSGFPVDNHQSFHFEKIPDWQTGCPTAGCYETEGKPIGRTSYEARDHPPVRSRPGQWQLHSGQTLGSQYMKVGR